MFTQSTAPVIVLTLLAALMPGRWRLVLLGGLMTFNDAGLIVSPVPLAVPWFVFAVLLLTGFWQRPADFFQGLFLKPALFPYVIILANFIAILGVLSIWNNKFMVMPNFAFYEPARAVKIDLFNAHINQLIYLVLGVGASIWIIAFCQRRGWLETFERIEATFCGYVLIGSGIACWEWACLQTGAPFPMDFFHSDLTTLAAGQHISGVGRVQGPFSEPSELGASLGLSCALLSANLGVGKLGWLRNITIPMTLFALFVSTSTSGYFMIVLNVGVILIATLSAPALLAAKGVMQTRDIVASGRMLLLLLLGGGLILGLLDYFLNDLGYARVLQETLFQKTRSLSYYSRQFADNLGFQAFLDSAGMGVGMGGHVSSSGISSILATLGVLGAFAIWAPLLAAVFSPLAAVRKTSLEGVRGQVLSRLAVAAAAGAMLSGMLFAVSQLNVAYFWLVYTTSLLCAAEALGGRRAAPVYKPV